MLEHELLKGITSPSQIRPKLPVKLFMFVLVPTVAKPQNPETSPPKHCKVLHCSQNPSIPNSPAAACVSAPLPAGSAPSWHSTSHSDDLVGSCLL